MCGRFTKSFSGILFLDRIGSGLLLKPLIGYRFVPRVDDTSYNVVPTQDVLAIRGAGGPGYNAELVALRWGLVPRWSKAAKTAYATFNARVESVATSRMFREPLRHRRCLILADGWYEWRVEGGRKQPYLFRAEDGSPFAFAGLWEHWSSSATGEVVESCTILVGPADAYVAQVHERMPLRVAEKDYQAWLEEGQKEPEAALALLAGTRPVAVRAYPVSTAVNRSSAQGPQLVEPVGPAL